MKSYVVGFLFDPALNYVALIEKNRPAWQAGMVNGIGGKIEDSDQSPLHAMIREFHEEAGVLFIGWRQVVELIDKDWTVHVFAGVSEMLFDVTTMSDERVFIQNVHMIPPNTVPNVPWLIPMLRYALKPGSDFSYATAHFNFAPDPLTVEAAAMFGVPPDQVTNEQRLLMKGHKAAMGYAS